MSDTRDGGPAFPYYKEVPTGRGTIMDPEMATMPIGGLTKRELFAGLAMAGLLAADPYDKWEIGLLARHSYVIADAMLAEGRKP